jgi:hypothetical protein
MQTKEESMKWQLTLNDSMGRMRFHLNTCLLDVTRVKREARKPALKMPGWSFKPKKARVGFWEASSPHKWVA